MLESLFTSKARIEVLKTLLLEPQSRFYLRELAARTGLPVRSVQVELKRLTDAGILERETSGKQSHYRINERCPITPELRSMFVKTVGLADALRDAMTSESDAISCAFVYGSFATGDIRSESDVDLFVVGGITLRRLTTLLRSANSPRAINPIVMSEDEFGSRRAEGDHFVASLLESPKVFLIGDEDGLSRLS